MTPDAQAKHARESLLLVIARKDWTEAQMREYAAECLSGQGVPIADARKVVQAVWDERFETWGPV
jgi:hypothetical protein